jgi:hypothetical protein
MTPEERLLTLFYEMRTATYAKPQNKALRRFYHELYEVCVQMCLIEG